jgi:hypothetical protein
MASEERHFPRLIMKYCGTTRLPIGELKRQLAKPRKEITNCLRHNSLAFSKTSISIVRLFISAISAGL